MRRAPISDAERPSDWREWPVCALLHELLVTPSAIINLGLMMAAILSSVLVVQSGFGLSILNMEIDSLRAERDLLLEERSSLFLELGTLSRYQYVESDAEKKLSMRAPTGDETVVIAGE